MGTQLGLRVVPQVPLAQDALKRAVAHDLVNRRINLRLERVVAFTQTDDVSAALKRRARRFQTRILARVIHLHRHIHQYGVNAAQL